MGLVAIDVVTALTIGRGGQFVESGSGLRYLPSGREPRLQLFCRSGLPFTAKSVTGKDRTDVYKPLICTDAALDALSGRANGRRRLVDVRRELLPLLFAEMYSRYYAQAAFQAEGTRAAGAAVRDRLRAAWADGRFDAELASLSRAVRPASMPRSCSSDASPSTAPATTTSGLCISRWPTICARRRCRTAPAPPSLPAR